MNRDYQIRDIGSQRFGLLTAVKLVGRKQKIGAIWSCVCDCGNEKVIAARHLTEGKTKSCGCLMKQRPKRAYNRWADEDPAMTFAEIGDRLNMTPQCAQLTLDRALKKLRKRGVLLEFAPITRRQTA